MVKAAQYYEHGSEYGDDDCTTALALCLLHGDGVEKDEARAVRLLEKAAANGNENAQEELLALRAGKDGQKIQKGEK